MTYQHIFDQIIPCPLMEQTPPADETRYFITSPDSLLISLLSLVMMLTSPLVQASPTCYTYIFILDNVLSSPQSGMCLFSVITFHHPPLHHFYLLLKSAYLSLAVGPCAPHSPSGVVAPVLCLDVGLLEWLWLLPQVWVAMSMPS